MAGTGDTDDGAPSVVMLRALLAGVPYPPPGVADTAENKTLWAGIAADIDAMPGGVLPDVPNDWTETPGGSAKG
jgi:hypothetical protein